MVLLECITSSTILLTSELQLIDKTGVPPSIKLKHVKVVRVRAELVGVRVRVKTELKLVVGLRLILLLNWNHSNF